MQNPIESYWQKRLEAVGKALEANNFQVFIVQSAFEAGDLVLNTLMPRIDPKVVSWGGSMTIGATGITEAFRKNPGLTIIDPYEPGLKPEEAYEKRRQGLLADLFFAGTNALTENGELVNLDATGNRVGAIGFGPKHVVLAIGRNKLMPDLATAMELSRTLLHRSTRCDWIERRPALKHRFARTARARAGFAMYGR